VVYNKHHVLLVNLAIIILVVVHLNVSYVHQDIIVSILVLILFLAQREQQLTNTVKYHVHLVVLGIIQIFLVKQLVPYVQLVVNAVMHRFHPLLAR
jgi:hypothetical protein